MKDRVLARRYAKALLYIAKERDVLDSVSNEVNAFNIGLQENPRFRLFLYSQDKSVKEKTKKLEEVLQDKVSNIFFNFLLVLLNKKREFIFTEIAREFQLMVDKYNKKTRAFATTAIPLDEKSLSSLKSVLDKAFALDVQLENKVDESILGGVIVSIDGKLLDASIKNHLQLLKSELLDKDRLN